MRTLNLKPTHKANTDYYAGLDELAQLDFFGEGAVAPAFAALLRHCAASTDWTLAEQYSLKRGGRTIRVDGGLVDSFKLPYGYWEAKDSDDDFVSFSNGVKTNRDTFQNREVCMRTFDKHWRWVGLLCCWLIAACALPTPTPAPPPTAVAVTVKDVNAAPRIPVAEAKQHFDAGSALFIDVRDAEAFALSHIPGAVHLPLGEVQLRHGELPKDRLLILY
ncbi:MAG: rhodanese-like domain-containing protein [Chloroflexi bacterium]|nr:rhodanese-like domain-containing protein [Chloroflexota bacterium]